MVSIVNFVEIMPLPSFSIDFKDKIYISKRSNLLTDIGKKVDIQYYKGAVNHILTL